MSFGSKIKIDRYLKSRVKYCTGDFQGSNFTLSYFNDSTETLQTYNYMYDGPLVQLELVRESPVIPAVGVGAFFVDHFTAPDDTVFLTEQNGDSNSRIIRITKDGTIEPFTLPGQPTWFTVDSFGKGDIFLSDRTLNGIRRFDNDFNLLDFAQYPGFANAFPIVSSDGRVFVCENWIGSDIYEYDPNDLSSTPNAIDLNDQGLDVNRSRHINHYIDDQLIVTCSGDFGAKNGEGWIFILNYDLEIQQVIRLSEYPSGVHVDGGTGRTKIAATREGFIAVATTSNLGDSVYCIDPATETVVWRVNQLPTWSLGGTRPTDIEIDTFGNFVIKSGLGTDPRYITVVQPDGTLVVQETVSSNDALSVGVNYSNWILAL